MVLDCPFMVLYCVVLYCIELYCIVLSMYVVLAASVEEKTPTRLPLSSKSIGNFVSKHFPVVLHKDPHG